MWKASVAAVLVAGVLLVTVVMPAEFGIDPLGTGRALGLLGLAGSEQAVPSLHGERERLRTDRMRFELAPFESVEYKYRLAASSGLLYDWTATGELVYDLHAEPDGGKPGYAESFATGRSGAERGTYIAPFSGIHGWFWQNRSMSSIALEIEAAGFFTEAVIFRGGGEQVRRLEPPG